ncbi:MAG TPA: CD225/dispanin family protein [Candidatus Eisenbacteria bacterium]|nr:CD225/dispanin family protein [Candidatus Eisenbacteria bacterium]
MFCPQCGATNADNAAVCVQCGRILQPTVPPTPLPVTGTVIPPQGTTVPNYLVFAILATVFCCLPTGIPAIIYAAQVNGKLAAGDYAGAQAASNNAKIWCWVSFGIGLVGTMFWILIAGVGMLRHLPH